MKLRTSLILGCGEIGSAYYSIFSQKSQTYRLDLRPELSDKRIPKIEVLHVCLRHSENFQDTVTAAVKKYRPAVINNMSTVPPGTTEKLGNNAVHSTTRGLHPNLKDSILAAKKHIGGPKALELAEYFAHFGIQTVTHAKAKTTELAHILSNTLYGVQIMYADEMDKLCRQYGVDYFEAVQLYSMTHNEAYSALGLQSKYRPILSPPGGRIGGHCVTQGAALIPENIRGPLLSRLATFNKS